MSETIISVQRKALIPLFLNQEAYKDKSANICLLFLRQQLMKSYLTMLLSDIMMKKNKAHYYKMMNVPDCWQRKHYDVDEEWVLLERKQKINIKTK